MKKRSQQVLSAFFSQGSKKRGQVTIFIIAAIVRVVGIIIYTTTIAQNTHSYSNKFLVGNGLSDEADTIRQNIFDCIDTTTTQALITIGVQGGRYEKPEHAYDVGEGFFSYYYYEGSYHHPQKEDVEGALSRYIEDNLETCITQYEYPIDTTYSPITVTTAITKEETIFTIDSQVSFTEDETVRLIELKEKPVRHTSYLYGMIEIAQYLTEYHNTDPKYFCFTCLSEMAKERGVSAEVYNFTEKDTTHVIIYEEETNAPNIYMFSYLNKYTGKETSPLFDEP